MAKSGAPPIASASTNARCHIWITSTPATGEIGARSVPVPSRIVNRARAF
jgi:hypothetical protein